MSRKIAASLITGSKLYGIDTHESDTDTIIIYYPTVREMLGIEKFKRSGGDRSKYTLLDISRLLLKGSPNIWELLFATPIVSSDEWDILQGMRTVLWTDNQANSVMGYIHSHRKETERRYAWLNGEGTPKGFTPNKYELKYGWDTKKAVNALRWLYQVLEYTTNGTFGFPRPEHQRKVLLAVRGGEISYGIWKVTCDTFDKIITSVTGDFTIDQAKEMMELYLVCLFHKVENNEAYV